MISCNMEFYPRIPKDSKPHDELCLLLKLKDLKKTYFQEFRYFEVTGRRSTLLCPYHDNDNNS